eukprot:403347517
MDRWYCDGCRMPHGCLSQFQDPIRWRCIQTNYCDFDLCNTCADYYEKKQQNQYEGKSPAKSSQNSQLDVHDDQYLKNPLLYGFALMNYSEKMSIENEGPHMRQQKMNEIRSEVGNLVVDNLFDFGSEVLSSVIPFAGTAIKIIKMLFGQSENKEREIEEQKRRYEMIQQTKQMFWDYDYKKTMSQFKGDIDGVLTELKFMHSRDENSKLWWDKAIILDSTINLLVPKFTSQDCSHHMLKLQLGATLIGIHLALLHKLAKINKDDGYRQDDVNIYTDKYLNVLSNLITSAAAFRIESLFGFQEVHGSDVGGLVLHEVDLRTNTYFLKFLDDQTGEIACIKSGIKAPNIQNNKYGNQNVDLAAFNLSYFLGQHFTKQYQQGDIIQQATIMLTGLQKRRNIPQTGVLMVNWKRAKFSDRLQFVKIMVEKCELQKGTCNIKFDDHIYEWDLNYRDDDIIAYSQHQKIDQVVQVRQQPQYVVSRRRGKSNNSSTCQIF